MAGSSQEESQRPRSFSRSDPYPLYCGLNIAYGLVNGLTSPALPDLAEQARLSSSEIGAATESARAHSYCCE